MFTEAKARAAGLSAAAAAISAYADSLRRAEMRQLGKGR